MLAYILFMLTGLLYNCHSRCEDFHFYPGEYTQSLDQTRHFMQPVKFSHHGLRCFIKHIFNVPEYTDFLANNFFHMVQFLDRKAPLQKAYCQSVLRMFGNRIKQASYVNAYAFSEMLDEILPILKRTCHSITDQAYKQLKKNISQVMYESMLNKFEYLKLDPDAYFKDLSENIIILFQDVHNNVTDNSNEQVRKSLMCFFESTLNKLIWDPEQPKEAWQNTKLIADQLIRFHEQDILPDQDDLHDLFVSLLERFCLYLDLSYAEIPLDFYAQLREDIAAKNSLLLELASEQYFETKAERLERAITLAETKTLAYQKGLIVS